MKKFTLMKWMLVLLALVLGSVTTFAQTEEVIYSTGFESSQSFTAATVYNNTTVAYSGAVGQQWGTYYGTPSTTSPIFGSQSMQMRWYTTSPANLGYTFTNFDLANVSKVLFKAAGYAGINVIVSYSVDGGNSYTGAQTFALSTTSADYTYNVSATGQYSSIRLKFQLTYTTAPTVTSRLYIDEVNVYAISGSTPTVATPTITPSGVIKTTNTYFNTADVTLASSTEGASIYYTVNGDVPTTSSTLYSAPVTVTSTTTFKAIAVKAEMDNSAVAEKTITIVAPATATVPYTEAFSNTLGDWYNYEVAGAKPWYASANGAYGNGFGGGDVESWLISPKFTATSAGLALSFNYASKYTGNSLLVKVSSDYTGIGSPATATWTTVGTIAAPTVQDDLYTVKSSGDIISSATGTTYFALVYDNDVAPYSDWRITNASVDVAPVAATPTITVTEVEVPAMSAETGLTDQEVLTVSAANLTGNITLAVSGANSGLFTLSAYTITPVDGVVTDVPVTITYAPLVAGSHAAIITLTSAGATSVIRNLTASATAPVVPETTPDVIISEVYGGGGNTGATLKQDFIELYNTTESSVSIGGWSVQYYSATGVGLASNVYVIPEGKYIPGKKHFLIQAAAGTGGSVDLSEPDAICTLALSGSNGKIILYTAAAAQTISDLASVTGNVNFKDYVPYGSTAVPVWGSATASTTNTTSATRKKVEGVYVYTKDIGADFEIVTPSPENTGLSTAINPLNSELQIIAFNNQIRFNATAGDLISVHNAVGQQLVGTTATDGQNILNMNARGVMIVKVGNRIAKVIL